MWAVVGWFNWVIDTVGRRDRSIKKTLKLVRKRRYMIVYIARRTVTNKGPNVKQTILNTYGSPTQSDCYFPKKNKQLAAGHGRSVSANQKSAQSAFAIAIQHSQFPTMGRIRYPGSSLIYIRANDLTQAYRICLLLQFRQPFLDSHHESHYRLVNGILKDSGQHIPDIDRYCLSRIGNSFLLFLQSSRIRQISS